MRHRYSTDWRFIDEFGVLDASVFASRGSGPAWQDGEARQRLLVDGNSEVVVATSLLALLQGSYEPVLASSVDNAKSLAGIADFEPNVTLNTEGVVASPVTCDMDWLAEPVDRGLSFVTSGSTGYGKLIRKDLSSLLNEAGLITKILNLDEKSIIRSLVSIRHIYGFLFGFLSPLVSGATSILSHHANAVLLPRELQADKEVGEIILAVPAQWSLVKQLISDRPVEAVVFSGAVFGETRRSEWKEILDKTETTFPPTTIYEFFGSTETGGIGYRDVLDKSFTVYPSITLNTRNDGRTSISSPYCPNISTLDDQLSLSSNGRNFQFEGRHDRVFKFSGRRISLAEVESALAKVAKIERDHVYAFFIPNENSAHGGSLIAYILGSVQKETLGQALPGQVGLVPLPEEVYVVPSAPMPERGKVGLDFLASIPDEQKTLWSSLC